MNIRPLGIFLSGLQIVLTGRQRQRIGDSCVFSVRAGKIHDFFPSIILTMLFNSVMIPEYFRSPDFSLQFRNQCGHFSTWTIRWIEGYQTQS